MAKTVLAKLGLGFPAAILLWAGAAEAQNSLPVPQPAAQSPLLAKAAWPVVTNQLNAPIERPAAPATAEKLGEKELLLWLTSKLQPNNSTDELELRLAREWKPLPVPSGPLDLRVLDKPSSGLPAQFAVRFELMSGQKSLGVFVAFVQAHLYRDVWVARSPVKRATTLDLADLDKERRDVINLREATWSRDNLPAPFQPSDYQLIQGLPSGQIIFDRYVQLRPVMLRGQHVQAVIKDEFMMVSAKVEVLEDGAPGQFVRARNLKTRKEIRGKVINEDTIQIMF